MKKIKITISSIFLFFFIFSGSVYAEKYEMRGAWITTVYNKDWPSKSSYGNVTKQKQEFINILDELKSLGINTVVVQVRTAGDALYKSNINPWSRVLTGTQGKDPGYDPLKFMIEETHKRGMEFHAWFNPYRVTTSGTNLQALDVKHPARQNPDWIIYNNGAMYYDPSNPDVKNHIVDTIKEVVKNYDVDAIHFDDYFYPEKYPLSSGEGKDGNEANARRSHVNEMVRSVYNAIKSIDSSVEFGISPSGVWKNKSSDITGSDTRGNESYYSVYADTRTWIRNGWIDYVVPQIYWEIGNSAADYKTLVKWWNNEVDGTKTKLYIGQGIYKDIVRNEIYNQIKLNDQYENIKGSIYYTTSDILENQVVKDAMKLLYKPGWKYSDNRWYLLDEIGIKKTGWQKVNNVWYYLDSSGAMKTGWQKINNVWYYLDSSGAMKTGWQKINNVWYYLDNSGAMKTGWQKINNMWYYLDSSGAMKTGWQKINNVWYYLDSSGAMKTGWLKLDDKIYYLKLNGAMVTGKVYIDGKDYSFAANGELII